MSSDAQIVQLLVEIRERLENINTTLAGFSSSLQTDRTWLWRILAMTIIGAFALIGVKMVLP